MKRLTPKLLLTSICVVWSLTTIFTGFIHNIGGLYATRIILGACEAGLFPGLTLYISMVYRREEQGKRVGYLFSCSALSGAFGGLLAFAILKMDGVSGIAGWRYVHSGAPLRIYFRPLGWFSRWVYIIEGIFSIVCAFAVWFGLPNDPSNAYFLNDEEKHMMRCRAEQRKKYMGSDKFDWKEVKVEFQDPKLYLRWV